MEMAMTTAAPAKTDTVTVLYDRDCGFCRWSLAKILAWDRRRRLRPLPIQSEEGQRLLAGMPEDEQLRSWHLVHPDGRVESAGDGFPALFSRLPGGRPIAALTRRLPRLSNRGYRLVADNRDLFGKPLTAGMKDRATARIDACGPQDVVFTSGPGCERPRRD
jgi:predicted DCC family thiol-disulfide oxidoreductase YuxK